MILHCTRKRKQPSRLILLTDADQLGRATASPQAILGRAQQLPPSTTVAALRARRSLLLSQIRHSIVRIATRVFILARVPATRFADRSERIQRYSMCYGTTTWQTSISLSLSFSVGLTLVAVQIGQRQFYYAVGHRVRTECRIHCTPVYRIHQRGCTTWTATKSDGNGIGGAAVSLDRVRTVARSAP